MQSKTRSQKLPDSHKFLLGLPLLIAVLFSYGFIMMQTRPHHPVSSSTVNQKAPAGLSPLTVGAPPIAAAQPRTSSKPTDSMTAVPVTTSPQTNNQPVLQSGPNTGQADKPAASPPPTTQDNKLLKPVRLINGLISPLNP